MLTPTRIEKEMASTAPISQPSSTKPAMTRTRLTRMQAIVISATRCSEVNRMTAAHDAKYENTMAQIAP